MKPLRLTSLLTVAVALATGSDHLRADVKLPTVIDSHMVLQRDAELTIWGWADPGEEVTVSLDDHSATTKGDDNGNWSVKLPAMKADGKAHSMTVAGKNTISLEDILIGDVWVGSGQSNMEWPLSATHGAQEAIAEANHPNIRLFHVPKVQKPEAASDVVADWQVCTSDNIPKFSAVLYYFGRKLHQEVDVPIGLVNSSWGGSPIEPWTVADGKGGGMYNGMIAPLLNFSIKGAIWYQGETNAGRAYEYASLFPFMIQDWRTEWKQGDFPFYWVQLADFMAEKTDAEQATASQWAELRESQTKTQNAIPNGGQAVIIDLGEANDIHPKNKRDVAERLARWALVKDYGMKLPYRSPEFKSAEFKDGKAIVTLDTFGSTLRTVDISEVKGFVICGEDKKWTWAEAKIVGKDKLEVSAKGVAKPVAVRYAWSDNPVCNLFSTDGLPVTPFRSDDFEMLTKPKP